MSVNKNVIFKDFNLTPRAKKAYSDAHSISKELGHSNINNLHVFYGCIKNSSSNLNSFLFKNGLMITDEEVIEIITLSKRENDDKFFANKNSDPWHKEVLEAIKNANEISNNLDQYYVGIEHIILGIMETSSYVFKNFNEITFDFEILEKGLRKFIAQDSVIFDETSDYEDPKTLNDFEFDGLPDIDTEQNPLPDFVTNLNDLYSKNKLPEVYGRDEETNLLIETISKKNKCNAILTGEAGVGKTSIVESLARKICEANVPMNLIGMDILSIDLGTMLAGTQYRGQFEQKFKTMLDVARKNPNIILFFDEIHTIFGAGGNQEGGLDAANMLKPLLARGEIKCIGSTTSAEYEKIFKKDGAMKRRFFNINVEEPTKEETKKILYKCKSQYEDFHKVKFSRPIINYIVDLSDSLISHKKFPDKAFDIIDQAGSRVKIKKSKPNKNLLESHSDLVNILAGGDDVEVNKVKDKFENFLQELKKSNNDLDLNYTNIKKEDIIEIISEHSNISIDQVKNSRNGFSSFLPRISKEVFGQDKTLSKINDLLSCAKAGLTEENKPLSSMFFVGPTSVGKTYTAKKIAKNFFGNEKAMLQINMSELYDKTGISKLIGSNAGYVGHEEGGILTKFVKDNPNCVVLFDEVEKADPQVLNLLLHLLDEGYIEDSKHNKVDFSKSIVILTSNIGHEKANKKSMGFVQDEITKDESYKSSVTSKLKPELLARINEVLVFDELVDKDIKRIIKFELDRIKERLDNKSISIIFNKTTIDCIFNNISKKNMHVRDLKSYIREKIQIPIAKIVVSSAKTSKINIKNIDNKIKVC